MTQRLVFVLFTLVALALEGAVARACVMPDPGVRELILQWAPIPGTPQEGFIDDDTPDADIAFFGGYAAGKTLTLTAKMLKLSAINAPLPGLWVVPDYAHIHDTILPTLTELDPDTGLPWFLTSHQFTYNDKHHRLDWIGGGPILFVTAENPDSIAGPNVAFAGCDEPGKFRQAAWRNTVARVRNPRARLRQRVLAGTPEGLNWMAEYFGPDRPANRIVYVMRTEQNTELLRHHPDYLEQVRGNATEAELAAYLGGKFTNMLGALAYPTFDELVHWRPDVELHARLPLRLAFDFNVEPMTCIVGQQVPGPAGPVAVVHVAFALYNATVSHVCAAVRERFPTWAPGLVIYGDATGKARNQQSLKSNYAVIQEDLAGIGPLTMKVPTANPPIARRLNSVNRMLRTPRGLSRVVIAKTLPARQCVTRELVRSLQQTVRKPGTDDIWKKAGETISHAGDAFGYWIDYEWPAQRPGRLVGHA